MNIPKNKRPWLVTTMVFCMAGTSKSEDTFIPITETSKVPQHVIDLWEDYDPAKEPLDIQVVKTWDEEGVICKYILYTVCTFKAKPSRVSAYYTYPTGKSHLPAFVYAHGGGQCARKQRCYHFAQKGYAVIDINWGGKDGALEEGVTVNTDWGALDPTQGPKHYKKSPRTQMHKSIKPDEYTIDTVPSPRNHPDFLRAVAGRRAITFLEQQAEVDPNRIGFTGFSVGGSITSRVAIDKRLKAVIPVVGGTGYRSEPVLGYPGRLLPGGRPRSHIALAPQHYWPLVKCPVLFVSSSNDFNASFDRVSKAMEQLPHNEWRISQGMHTNHGPLPEQWLAFEYWFDCYLKGEGTGLPERPKTQLEQIDGTDMMRFIATPDDVTNVKHLVVYYSYEPMTTHRFNKNANAIREGDSWIADIKRREDLPLYVFAQAKYNSRSGQKEKIFTGYGASIKKAAFSDSFSIISKQHILLPESTKELELPMLNDPKRTFNPVFEDFTQGWEWEWIGNRSRLSTYKFNDNELSFPAEKRMAIKIDNPGGKLTVIVVAKQGGKRFRFANTVSNPGPHEMTFGLSDMREVSDKASRLTSWYNISLFMLESRSDSTEVDLSDILTLIYWIE